MSFKIPLLKLVKIHKFKHVHWKCYLFSNICLENFKTNKDHIPENHSV